MESESLVNNINNVELNGDYNTPIESESRSVDVKRAKNLPQDMEMVCCQKCQGLLTLDGSKFCDNDGCDGHQYCRYCVSSIKDCESCKKEFNPANISKKTLNFMKKLEIQCSYKGCKENVSYEKLEDHEKDCGYKESSCPYCFIGDIKSKIDLHKLECKLRDFECLKCRYVGIDDNDHSCESTKFLLKKIENQEISHRDEINELKKLCERLSNRLFLLEGLQGAIPSAEEFVDANNFYSNDNSTIKEEQNEMKVNNVKGAAKN